MALAGPPRSHENGAAAEAVFTPVPGRGLLGSSPYSRYYSAFIGNFEDHYRMLRADDRERRTKEVSMRKVIASEFVSLDGVMESPEQWHFPYFNDEMGEAIGAAMAQADAMLMGRVLYEEWAAYWPQQDPEENPVAEQMNGVQKYVVSTTLEGPLEWQNSTLIQGDVVEEISELKRQPGKDIVISGSGALVRSLLRDGLIDELRLMVHPIVVGSGKRLFEDGEEQTALELVESTTFATGVLYLIYRPASE